MDALEKARARNDAQMKRAVAQRQKTRASRVWLKPGFNYGPPLGDTEWPPKHGLVIRSAAQKEASRRMGLAAGSGTSAFSAAHPFGLTRKKHMIALQIARGDGRPGCGHEAISEANGLTRVGVTEAIFQMRIKLRAHGISIIGDGYDGREVQTGRGRLISRFRFDTDILAELEAVPL